jgi:hypothetical protein
VGRILKKLVAAILAFGASGLIAAQAADLPVKAKRLPAEPTWWVSGGALIWGVKGTPLPPTLTTFSPGSPSATTGFGGDLGVAGTTVLSPGSMNPGPFGGGEFSVGRWLADPRWGVEFSGFFLAQGNANFGVTSDGTTPLRVPFNNVPPGAGFPLGSSSFVLADPGFATGGQTISTSLQLWGIDGNVLHREIASGPLSVSLLAGVRYIDLREGLSIVSTENKFGGFGGPGNYVGTDNFTTRNQFFGAQIGVKAREQFGQFDVSGLAKIALGDNYQTVSINGSSVASGPGFVGVGGAPFSPAGIFTQSTNTGQFSRNQFAVAPQVEIEGGYRLQNGVRLFVGYDFLYISNVVRPGNQIDTTINLTSNATIAPPGTLTGAARPMPLINGSSFWAQGVKFGASYAF